MSSDVRRPRAPRRAPDERRAGILAAASALAAERGLSAVTMRAVAARAGVAPALVAHYADGGMDGLVAAAFEDIVARELVEVTAIADAQPEPRVSLAALVRTVAGGERDAVTGTWVEAWALGRRNEPLAAAVRRQMNAWQALLERIIDAGAASGAFRVADVGEAAWQALGMIDGVNAQSLVRWGDTSERSALLLRAIEGMLGAG